MTEEIGPYVHSSSSTDPKEAVKTGRMDRELSISTVLDGGVKEQQKTGDSNTATTTTPTDTESGIFSGERELCVEHESGLTWFCGTEQKLICSHCATVGTCQGHAVTALDNRVTAVRVSVWATLNSTAYTAFTIAVCPFF